MYGSCMIRPQSMCGICKHEWYMGFDHVFWYNLIFMAFHVFWYNIPYKSHSHGICPWGSDLWRGFEVSTARAPPLWWAPKFGVQNFSMRIFDAVGG